MGWAARTNPRRNERARMARLRELCRLLPRDAIEEAMAEMTDEDRAIVQATLDQQQPSERVQ